MTMSSSDPQIVETSQATGEMTVVTGKLRFSTQGDADTVDLTAQIRRFVKNTPISNGTVTVFVPGATGAVTTLEFEPGVVHDFAAMFEQLAPASAHYEHNVTHADVNGHAHVRAGLLGPSLVIPFEDGRLCLGRWQEICFVCFDNRPRERTVLVQALGVR